MQTIHKVATVFLLALGIFSCQVAEIYTQGEGTEAGVSAPLGRMESRSFSGAPVLSRIDDGM